MNSIDETGIQTDQPIRVSEAGPCANRLPYCKPKLTRFGQMTDLTKDGGGPGANDGDLYPGRPLTS